MDDNKLLSAEHTVCVAAVDNKAGWLTGWLAGWLEAGWRRGAAVCMAAVDKEALLAGWVAGVTSAGNRVEHCQWRAS